MYFVQSYLSSYDLEMNLQVFSISEFLVDLALLELTKGKQRVKMLRFTLKLILANCVRFTPGSYLIKSYKMNEKIRNYYVWKSRQNYLRIALGGSFRFTFGNYVIKPCKWGQKVTK